MKSLEDVVAGKCSMDDYVENVIDNLNHKHKINETKAYEYKSEIINTLTDRILNAMKKYANELEEKGLNTHITDDCFYVRFSDGSQLETILNGSYAIRTNKMREYALKTKQHYCKEKYKNATIDSWNI